MKKTIATAFVLGFVGVAAAFGVHRVSCGQCPLTGRPIHSQAAPVADTIVLKSGSVAITNPTAAFAAGTESVGTCPVAGKCESPAAAAEVCPSAETQEECVKRCEDQPQRECCKHRIGGDNCKKDAPPVQKPE